MIRHKPPQASYASTWDKVTIAFASKRYSVTPIDLPVVSSVASPARAAPRLFALARRARARAVVLVAWLALAAHGGLAEAHTIEGRVVAVADGDTIVVLDIAGVQHRVRLLGIDAPELGQPGGYRSKDSLWRLVYERSVRVEWNKIDNYGRRVGKLWVAPPDCPNCGATLDAGLEQLTIGRAWWFRRFAAEQSAEDRGRYEFAEQEARSRKAGLWRSGNPVPPWEWRAGRR